MSTSTAQSQITLSGSCTIVKEFFHYAINTILYQRGIYAPSSFRRESKYGLTVLVSEDEGLQKYIDNVMGGVEDWLREGMIERLVVVVGGEETGETLERWTFNINVDTTDKEGTDKDKDTSLGSGVSDENTAGNATGATNKKPAKSTREINLEIAAIIRQITASVTFLPLLDEPCSFDLLVYTRGEATVSSKKWEDSDPRYIVNSSEVKLRSFTTTVHKVEGMVSYKEKDEWDL
ncbi:hypothetical protein TrCOL_g13214 [Triparma columacea]|uniref:HORMA domain-containing protein n=1 Tax=Triparma columacea TaxID=722753 RepID=A0A9W7GLC3_9STRA|nr:hypothetical protein TrCOL_g13214 [Triparma columacea]